MFDKLQELDDICSKVPREYLEAYVELSFSLAVGIDDVKEWTNVLASNGYGNSLEDINGYFKRHFKECQSCDKKFKTSTGVMQLLYRARNYKIIPSSDAQ